MIETLEQKSQSVGESHIHVQNVDEKAAAAAVSPFVSLARYDLSHFSERAFCLGS